MSVDCVESLQEWRVESGVFKYVTTTSSPDVNTSHHSVTHIPGVTKYDQPNSWSYMGPKNRYRPRVRIKFFFGN